jgi:hypothetical protein
MGRSKPWELASTAPSTVPAPPQIGQKLVIASGKNKGELPPVTTSTAWRNERPAQPRPWSGESAGLLSRNGVGEPGWGIAEVRVRGATS